MDIQRTMRKKPFKIFVANIAAKSSPPETGPSVRVYDCLIMHSLLDILAVRTIGFLYNNFHGFFFKSNVLILDRWMHEELMQEELPIKDF